MSWKKKNPEKVCVRTCGTDSPSQSEALRFVDFAKSPPPSPSPMAEAIKHSASDWLGESVPQVPARTFPGFFSRHWFLGICLEILFSYTMIYHYVVPRVHKNKSRPLHTMGSVTAEFEVRHRWRTTTLFSGRYALNAEHVHARSLQNLQKLHLFDWHFRRGLHFACTCSSKYSVQRRAQRSRINVFPFLVQTDVGSDDELRILPWQHS